MYASTWLSDILEGIKQRDVRKSVLSVYLRHRVDAHMKDKKKISLKRIETQM